MCVWKVFLCLFYIHHGWVTADLSGTVRTNENESWRTFCHVTHLCVCVQARVFESVHTCVCVSDLVSGCQCKCIPCQKRCTPAFPTTVSLGCRFPANGPQVSMCNNDYLPLNHKEQENPDSCNTQRNPRPTPTSLDPDQIWRQDLLGSAQP